MNADAITTAVREVALGALGSVRTVTAGTTREGVYAGLNDSAAAVRAMVDTAVDVSIPRVVRSGAVGPQTANIEVLAIEVDVLITHATKHEIIESERHATRAQAAEDATTIRRALGWPGNLTATAAGAATGIVSSCLVERAAWSIDREDWPKRILQSRLRLRGWVRDAQPVS